MLLEMLLSPFVAMYRLKHFQNLCHKLEFAAFDFMQVAVPTIFFVCTLIIVKAVIQSMLHQKNQDKKLTFVAALMWGFFGVLSVNLFQQIVMNQFLMILCSLITLTVAIVVPAIIMLSYIFNAIFCCEEGPCHRGWLSLHPPTLSVVVVLLYLLFISGWLLIVLQKQQLIVSSRPKIQKHSQACHSNQVKKSRR